MGDESAVSGMSEVSTAEQSTAQGAGAAGQSKGGLIVVVLLVIAAAAGILIVSGVFKSNESSEHETEDDAPSPSGGGGGGGGGSGGGGAPSAPPSAPDDELTSTVTTTTTTSRPMVLMCTTRYPGPGNDPPQHLCDIFVYDTAKTDLTSSPPAEVGFFMDYCKKGQAACGLNVEFPDGVLEQLDTPETRTVMKGFYAAGIKSYGLLRSEISTSTKQDDMKDHVGLLKKLETFLNTSGDNGDILFWGVSPLLEGAGVPPDSMIKVFLGVLKSATINMVVYQTTYVMNGTSSDPFCLSTGPAVWMSAPFPKQPNFVDALNFWKAVRAQPLPGVAEMLALSLCGYWTKYSGGQAKMEFGVKDGCDYTQLDYLEDYICTGGGRATNYVHPGTLLKDSQEYVTTAVAKEWAGGYDMNDTIVQKMCMASINYGYDGGWVVHDLQCNFKELCGGKDLGGFPRVRAVNDSMRQVFTKCDYTH